MTATQQQPVAQVAVSVTAPVDYRERPGGDKKAGLRHWTRDIPERDARHGNGATAAQDGGAMGLAARYI
jgi:hypothetical protein